MALLGGVEGLRLARETSAGPHLRLALRYGIAGAARALGKRRAHSLCRQARGNGRLRDVAQQAGAVAAQQPLAPPAHLPPRSGHCPGRWLWPRRCSLGGGGGQRQQRWLGGSCLAPAAGLPQTQASWRQAWLVPALEWLEQSGMGRQSPKSLLCEESSSLLCSPPPSLPLHSQFALSLPAQLTPAAALQCNLSRRAHGCLLGRHHAQPLPDPAPPARCGSRACCQSRSSGRSNRWGHERTCSNPEQ